MKKFCFAVMFLSLGLFTIGCNEPAKPKATPKPETTTTEPGKTEDAKDPAAEPAAEPAAPADGPAADAPAEPADPPAADAPAEETK